MTQETFEKTHRMTGEMYAAIRAAAEEMGRTEYAAQLDAYAATHKNTRRFRYDPSPIHRMLCALLACDAMDAAAMAQAVNATCSALGYNVPAETVRIAVALQLQLTEMYLFAR